MEKKLRKGGLARLKANGTSTSNTGYQNGMSLVTHQELKEWYDSDDSKGMRCDGETKLPPTASPIPIYFERVYPVLRARCVGHWSYRRWPGRALLLDPVSGREVYINRELLEAV